MRVEDRDRLMVVSWADGKIRKRGPVVGWVCRSKKVCAIVLVKSRLAAVPLSELKVVRSREKK